MRATSATAPIVVGVDGSPAGLQAARWAATEAKRQGAPLRLVHAVPRLPRNPYPTSAWYISELRAAAQADGARYLAEACEAAEEIASDVEISEVQYMGKAAEVIGRESASARMVVIGATGRSGFGDLMIGSTALTLPSAAHAPVVIVRDDDDGISADSGPVAVDDGIVTDEFIATNVPGVFAAGDVANVRNLVLDHRIRLEHFAEAYSQGTAAA